MDTPSLVIAAAALGVSAWSVTVAKRTAREQLALQSRMLSLESQRERERRAETQRAVLTATVVRGAQTPLLRIHNSGPSQARAIGITIDGMPLDDFPHVVILERPVSTLGPGANVDYQMRTWLGMEKSVFPIEIQWEDDSGVARRWGSEIQL